MRSEMSLQGFGERAEGNEPVLFAASAQYDHVLCQRSPSEFGEQSRLSNSWFTCDSDELSIARCSGGQRILENPQLRFPSHEQGVAARAESGREHGMRGASVAWLVSRQWRPMSGCLRPVTRAEFREDVLNVASGGGRSDGERLRDLTVRQTAGDQTEDLPLAG